MGITHHFQASYLHAITRQLLMAADCPRHIADSVAGILVNANLAGHDSHGVLRIPWYLQRISEGGIVPAAEPQVTKESRNTLLIDGQDGFGHYVAHQAMTMAIDKAKEADMCGVSFVRTGHIGRVGEYAEMAARAGCVGMITVGIGTTAGGATVPFGGAQGVLDTNPIAVGVPTGDGNPFILDFATSIVAEGKIQVARSQNANLPEGYILDKEGRPSVNPADFYDGGYLLPFGRHKGYALSLLTCLLGGLSGNFDIEQISMSGAFMQVININAFTPLAAYQQAVRVLLDGIKQTTPAIGFDEVLVPGDIEQRTRAHRLANGVEIPDSIYVQLREWAGKLNVALSEGLIEAADVERYPQN